MKIIEIRWGDPFRFFLFLVKVTFLVIKVIFVVKRKKRRKIKIKYSKKILLPRLLQFNILVNRSSNIVLLLYYNNFK